MLRQNLREKESKLLTFHYFPLLKIFTRELWFLANMPSKNGHRFWMQLPTTITKICLTCVWLKTKFWIRVLPERVFSNHPCASVCVSVCVSVFKYLRDSLLVFSENLHEVGINKIRGSKNFFFAFSRKPLIECS